MRKLEIIRIPTLGNCNIHFDDPFLMNEVNIIKNWI